jgi:GNAT superfamily N-acetyltransferase
MSSRQGQIFDDYSNSDINLYFASYDEIEDLCNVINWAYRGKPSTSSSGERYSGWVSEQHLLIGERITPEELGRLIDDEQNFVILVAKLKISSGLKIVGCCKINMHNKSLQMLQMGDEEKNDVAVEFGLLAVDPDYQSQGIGTLLFNGAMVGLISSCILFNRKSNILYYLAYCKRIFQCTTCLL